MPSPNSPVTSALCESRFLSGPFTSRFQLSTVDSRLFPPNSFRLTHFRKNASASPLESHTFKTKDLKPFRFIHFQKKGGGPASSTSFPSSASFASSGQRTRVTNHQSPITIATSETRFPPHT